MAKKLATEANVEDQQNELPEHPRNVEVKGDAPDFKADVPKQPEHVSVTINLDPGKDEKDERARIERERSSLESGDAAKDKDYEAAYSLLLKLGFTSAMIAAFWGNVSTEERKNGRGKGNGVSASVIREVKER